MKLNSFKENIHSLNLILIVIIFAIYVFVAKNYYAYLAIYFYCLLLIKYQGVSFKTISFTVVGSFLFSFFCAYFIIFFPSASYQNSEKIDLILIKVPKELLLNQFRVFVQVGLVSAISFLSMRAIKFEKLMIFLMKKKYIGAYLGYPILLAFNSISLIKSELDKIKINARMRQLPILHQANMLFPLLVYAVRHADRGALSLITRGLNEDKAYYFDVELTKLDIFLFIIFILLVLVCTAL